MQHVFAAWIDPVTARGYTVGLIILTAAPSTAVALRGSGADSPAALATVVGGLVEVLVLSCIG